MMTLRIGNKNREALCAMRRASCVKIYLTAQTTHPASHVSHHELAMLTACHPRMFLSGIQTSSPQVLSGEPSTRDSGLKPAGMTDFDKKCGLAFTLIELLAVITIIGLLALLGITTFAKFGSNIRLKSAADQIASTLRLARDLAVTQNKTIRATIYPRGATSPNRIVLTDSGAQVEKPWIASPLIEIADSGPNGTPGGNTASNIDFSPYGTAANDSIHIIQKGTLIMGSPYSPSGLYVSANKSERVKCYTVTTDNSTARTQVYPYGKNAPWDTDLLSESPP